ncbi:MAG: DUF58 domain-containing protein [Phycisphaerae bacterium]|jgi:uncharacterized protein (DUF58 family)|nr:DUF58 domain-containing protein [Phycisphaerae bacterium]
MTSPTLRPPDELARGDFEMVVRRLADDLAYGMDVSRFVGSGLEYAKSRPYEQGDPIKMIDWKITARTNRPYVKEYETLKRTSLVILIDTSASMSITSTATSKHDLAVWIGAAIGLIGLRRMSPVALVGGGERETRFEPSLLRSDLWQALEPLRVGVLTEKTRLAERLRDASLRLDRSSLLVVLSDLHDPDAIDALRNAGHRHETLAIHLVDPAERGRLRAGFVRAAEAESGATFLAHGRTSWVSEEHVSSELVRSGVASLTLHTDRPFVAPLRQFLAFRPATGGGRG